MKQRRVLTAMAIAALFVGAAAAQDSTDRPNRSSDTAFVTKALQGSMAEVELGQLATQRASNEKVKQFGQQMVDDHSKAGDELKSIATQKGISTPSTIDAESKSIKNKLSNLNGAAFDEAYMQHMVKAHKKDIAEYEKEANSGMDPEIKAFAAKTLPTLKHHLQRAEGVLNAAKDGKRKAS